MRLPAFALFLLAAVSSLSYSQVSPAADTARVVVTPKSANEAHSLGIKLLGVFDEQSGKWIEGAVVRDTLGHEARTSQAGVAALNVLAGVMGYYLIEIRKEGYAPKQLRLRDSTSEFMVALTPQPLGSATNLPAVVTTAAATLRSDAGLGDGFAHRCELGARCVGRGEVDRHPTMHLPDLLAQVEGIHRTCTGSTGQGPDPNALALSPRMSSRALTANAIDVAPTCKIEMREVLPKNVAHPFCVPTYFLNGLPLTPGGRIGSVEAQTLIDKLADPSNITGIEVYPASEPTPLRFQMAASGCGAVVVWTR